MRPGTPGFVAARLRSAREARGLTAVALAAVVGVTRAAISQYERGDQSPAPAVMNRICSVLNLPLQHFLRAAPSSDRGVVFYRSLSSATKSARMRAERRYEWLREIVGFIESYVDMPQVNLPDPDLPDDPALLADDRIEDLATELRQYWGLGDGPISNVVWLLERHGIIVARHDIDDPRLDAFSERRKIDGRPYIVLNADKRAAARSRFDAAHELGHLLLHRCVEQRALNQPAVFALIEQQAHRFSAAFLMPETAFRRDVYSVSLDSFRTLKAKWRVSIGVMIKRAAQLGLIDPPEEQRLWLNYGRRKWRKREPLDDSLIPEEPMLVRQSVLLLLDQRIIQQSELPFILGLNERDVEELGSLPTGTLGVAQSQRGSRNDDGMPDVVPLFPEE